MSRRLLAIDAVTAVLVAAATIGLLATQGLGSPDVGARAIDGSGVLLAVLSALPLLVLHRYPLLAFGLTSVASVGLVVLSYPLDAPLGPLAATYGMALAYGGEQRTARRRIAMLAPAAFLLVTAGAYASIGRDVLAVAPSLLFCLLILTGVWIAGDRAQLRRARISELEEQARQSQREAVRERQLAAAEERARIARELHDSAGHAINVILVQAGAARLLRERDTAASQQAISIVERVARDTLGEIDQLVRALRDGTDEPPPPADPAKLEELLAHHRASGLQLASEVQHCDQTPPLSVTWATYRIVQEALTNAARHGRGSARMAVTYGPDAVRITMTNPSSHLRRSAGGGHGLVGMRERASLLGGSLQASDADGEFTLSAYLPYRHAPT